jgi:hypothetical protein
MRILELSLARKYTSVGGSPGTGNYPIEMRFGKAILTDQDGELCFHRSEPTVEKLLTNCLQ